jgi:hypothetical protein
VDGISDDALEMLDRMRKSAPREYKQIVAYFQRLADYGPAAYRPWFKKLEDAKDLHQLSHSRHRFLLLPHPNANRAYVLLNYFAKSSDDTPPHEVRKGLRLRKMCLQTLESEEIR